MRMTLRHIAAVTSFGIAACSPTDSPESTSPQPDSKTFVVLSVDTDSIRVSTSKQITARVTDAAGLLKLVPVSWKSSDPSVATVSEGRVTGVATGTAMVVATAGDGADTARIVVTPDGPILDVQPSAATVAVGDTIDFVATLRDKNGDPMPMDGLNWISSDTVAAKFVKSGTLVARAAGEISISAEARSSSVQTQSLRGLSSVKVFWPPVASVSISPIFANVYTGARLQLHVTLRDQQGRAVEGPVSFGSSDYSRATVTSDGLVTGVTPGSVVITATSGSRTGSAALTVLSAPAASVSLSLSSDTVLVGQEARASVTALDASGTPVIGRPIAYRSANLAVATVTQDGIIKGIATGSTTISAVVDTAVATQRVTVRGRVATAMSIVPEAPSVSVGKQSQLIAKVKDQYGVEIQGQAATWSSANQAIATVSQSGLVTAVSGGSTTISAVSGSLSASAVISVVGSTVDFVKVSPSTAALVIGGSPVTLLATAYDASGNVLSGRAASWSSLNPAIASVSASGVLSAISAGSTTVIANIEGKTASVAVTVSSAPAVPVASVTVTLANTTLNVGQQTQATAVLKDAQGNVLSRTISWSSLDTAVAKVSETGLITAYAGGSVAIIASSGGVSGAASLMVNTPTPTTVALVTLSVPTQNLTVGQSIQSVVTLKDAQGNVLTGRTITFSTANPSVVTVSVSGVITAVGPGTTKVRATSGSVWAEETLNVAAPTIASISVTPASATLSVGQTAQESAVAKDAQGNTISGVSFTWTTSNPGVATVSGGGMVSAVGSGSATIRAAASGVTGSMSVSVTSTVSTVASVTVSLSSSSILVGGTTQASASAKDAQGNTITGRAVTWSGGGQLAQISSTGFVTALAAGSVAVTATIDGVSNSASLTISSPLPPPASATVELPRVVPASGDPYPGRACTVTLAAGANVGTALSTARGGQVVCLAGGQYAPFKVPARATGDTGWIVVRAASMPVSEGTRITPSTAVGMPRIVLGTVAGNAITMAPGTFGWYLAGLEVTLTSSQSYALMEMGTTSQNTLSAVPRQIVLSRMWIHGTPTATVRRCVSLQTASTAIVDSWLDDCHEKGSDSQAIWGENGPGPYLIENNYLAGAGENIMFGGADPALFNNVPTDITIRRNHIATPIAWRGTGYPNTPWTKKNLLELKSAVRVLIEANVLEGSWADAQGGETFAFKSTNQSGGCRWCRTTDVTVRRNQVRNVGGGISLAAQDATAPVDTTLRRVYFSENVFENVGVAPYDGSRRGLAIYGVRDATIERTVIVGNLVSAMFFEQVSQNCAFRDNVLTAGQYGLNGTGNYGLNTLLADCPTYTWSNMTFIGSPATNYPSGTTWVSSESQSSLAAQIRSLVTQSTQGVVVP